MDLQREEAYYHVDVFKKAYNEHKKNLENFLEKINKNEDTVNFRLELFKYFFNTNLPYYSNILMLKSNYLNEPMEPIREKFQNTLEDTEKFLKFLENNSCLANTINF